MKTTIIKLTAFFLMLLLIVSSGMFIACVENGGGDHTTTGSNAGTDGASTTTGAEDTTPEFNIADYGNEDFVVLSGDPNAASYPAFYIDEDEPTDTMSSAVYARNSKVEEFYKITISQLVSSSINNDVKLSVDTGAFDFDVILHKRETIASLATGGYLYDFNELGIDFENPWWDTNCANNYEIGGKLFIMANDTSISNLAGARFFYFNKNLLAEYKLTSPHTYVQENNWTLENFLNLVNSVYADDGDGVRTGQDTYGLLLETGATNGNVIHLLVGCGVLFSSKTSEGSLEVNINQDKVDSIFSMLSPILSGENCLDYTAASAGADYSAFGSKYTYCRNLFAQDHFLLVQSSMGTSQQMEGMEGEGYGIAPNPKYDTNQETYYHKMDKLSNIWAIPNSVALNYEMISNVMDYWAYVSSETVMPAYYEITLKARRVTDPNDPEMLDLIKATIFYDISEVFGIDVTTGLWNGYTNGTFSSTWKSQSSIINKQIRALDQAIAALD